MTDALMTSTAVMESADPFAPIVDRFGRVFTYLRVSVNEKCNLRCRYCMPEEGVPLSPDEDLMSADDIARLVAVFARCGGRKVRLTGGEPLLRKDIIEIVRRVAATPGIRSVHLTTNGLLLDKRLDELRAAGLTGLNVSLDSLDDARFAEITRRPGGPAVRAALARAIATGFPSIKINVVALRGLNEDELGDFVEWTRAADVGIRFIELMPFDDHQIWKTGRFIKADWIVERLRELYPNLEPAEGSSTEHHVFRVPGWRGKFAVIPAYSRDLCGSCNRIRVTADGRIRNCLYGAEEFEVGSLLRGGADEEVATRLREAMLAKARDGWEAQHRAETVRVEHVRTSMTQIGG